MLGRTVLWRLALVAVCGLIGGSSLAGCAGAQSSEETTVSTRKKKKRKPKTKKELDAERVAMRRQRLKEERAKRQEIDEENKREAEEQEEEEDAEERPAKRTASKPKPAAAKKRVASEDDEGEEEEEEDEDEEDPKAAAKRAAEEKAAAKREADAKARAEREAKKEEAARKAKEEREAKAEAARKAKEEREEKAREAREAKAEAARKAKEERDAKAKAKAKAAEDEEDDEEEEEEDEEEETTPPPPKPKPVEKAKPAAAKPKPAPAPADDEGVIDMTGDAPAPAKSADAATEEEEEEDSEPAREFDESADDPLAEKRVAAIDVPGIDGDGDTDNGEAPVVALHGLIDRPLTMRKGGFAAHGGLTIGTFTVRDPVAMTTNTTTTTGLALGATYGLTDKVEAGIDYTVGLSPGAIKGPFALHGAFAASRGGKFEAGFAGALAVDYSTIANSTTMTTSTLTNASLQLGVWLRYRATPKVSIFTGSPALPTTTPSLSKQSFALPPFAYQIALGLNNAGTSAIEIPIGVGIQAIPRFYGFFEFNVAHVRIANTQTQALFGDFIPIVLGGFYSLAKADIGLVFSDDLKQGGDHLRFDAMVRYQIK